MEGGGAVVADGPLRVHRIWWLLQCLLLVVPLHIALCLAGARLTTVFGAVLFLVALLRAFVLTLCFFFFC